MDRWYQEKKRGNPMKQKFKVGDMVRRVDCDGFISYTGKIVLIYGSELHVKRDDGLPGGGEYGAWLTSDSRLELISNNKWTGGVRERKEVTI